MHEPAATEAEQQQWLAARFPDAQSETFHRGRGCQSCNFTGYRGRVGVFELLEMTPEMMDALRAGDTVLFSQLARQSEGYQPLVVSAMALAQAGVTSLEEVMMLGEGDEFF